MKKLYQSKTFWIAILQSLVLILVAIQTEIPELAGIGIAKSLVDIVLRFITTDEVKL